MKMQSIQSQKLKVKSQKDEPSQKSKVKSQSKCQGTSQKSKVKSQGRSHEPADLPRRQGTPTDKTRRPGTPSPPLDAAATPPRQGGELLDPKIVEDCRELYLAYGGQSIARVEAEMRAKGHRFYRQVLYSKRRKNGTLRLG